MNFLKENLPKLDLIFKNFSVASFKSKSDYLYIDVGGGSLKLTLIRNGKRLRGKSFQIGTVRVLKGMVRDGEWDAVEEFLKYTPEKDESIMAIGTGGNINRLQRLILNPKGQPILISKIEGITKKLQSLLL